MEDGSVVARTAGTPQGGVVSPPANLSLHYAFDTWRKAEARRVAEDGRGASAVTAPMGVDKPFSEHVARSIKTATMNGVRLAWGSQADWMIEEKEAPKSPSDAAFEVSAPKSGATMR